MTEAQALVKRKIKEAVAQKSSAERRMRAWRESEERDPAVKAKNMASHRHWNVVLNTLRSVFQSLEYNKI